MHKKIILGTAQLGMNYGITNKKGKLNFKESKDILKMEVIEVCLTY